MKKDGFVESIVRSSYVLTERGRNFIASINQKPLLYKRQWDKQWHLVLMGFPETERNKRDKFRADILQTGFGSLYNGVFISPWPHEQEVESAIARIRAEEHITIFRGVMLNRSVTREMAWNIWKLAELQHLYAYKKKWFEEEFGPHSASLLYSGADPLELFILYLHLGEVISELYLADPMLPSDLLPETWIGKRILEQLQAEVEKLVEAIPDNSPYKRFVRSP